jgi:hypothetical protein
MSDVTAEEVRAERPRAHKMLTDARYMPCTHPDHNADCDVFATALAVRAQEARREALKEAREHVAGLVSCQDSCACFDGDCDRVKGVLEDLDALMGPET